MSVNHSCYVSRVTCHMLDIWQLYSVYSCHMSAVHTVQCVQCKNQYLLDNYIINQLKVYKYVSLFLLSYDYPVFSIQNAFFSISKGFATCSRYHTILEINYPLIVCLMHFSNLDHGSGQVCLIFQRHWKVWNICINRCCDYWPA